MTSATRERSRTRPRNEAEWLQDLLADIQAEVARQPNPRAIQRIRARLQAQIKLPARAAA
jgi:hypothetical protein